MPLKSRKNLILTLTAVVLSSALIWICLQTSEYANSYKSIERFVKDKSSTVSFKTGIIIKGPNPRPKNIFLNKTIVSINSDRPFPAASLIKLPIMAAVYSAAAKGKLNLNSIYTLKNSDKTGGSGRLKAMPKGKKFTLRQLIQLMVSDSDNTAANILIKKLGFKYLNRFFKKEGLKNTKINRYVLDLSSREKGIENYISAKDTAFILEEIYRGRMVDKKSSEEMMSNLLKQKVKDRICRYLPKNVETAHKTGTIKGIVHDCGIIFIPSEKASGKVKEHGSLTGFIDKRPLLICCLTEGAKTYEQAKKFIAKLSEIIYYFWRYK